MIQQTNQNNEKNNALASQGELYIIGIGASAGGLVALETFFRHMPADSGIACVVVQHLSPDFKSYMGELLARHTAMTIHRVNEGMPIEPNSIYLIPPGKNMVLVDGQLRLSDQERTGTVNLPIDIFLHALAQDVGERAIAIILSGTGSDGTKGVRAVRQAGGLVIIQDEASAEFGGMPQNAKATGVANWILHPEAMAPTILSHCREATSSQLKPVGAGDQAIEEDQISLVFAILRRHYKIDFLQYKPTTITRRLERRLLLTQTPSIEAYVRRLQDDEIEIEALYRDFLVEVTDFFRDKEAFDLLQSEAIAQIVTKASPNDVIRAWIAGCATGQEAYSLAMLFQEESNKQQKPLEFKIFATDAHQQSLAIASTAIYDRQRLASVPEEYLETYFEPVYDDYRVSSQIRQMVVFSAHNLLKDPPFSNLDLVSCRNLLIYLQQPAQKIILSRFHFSLKKYGFLLLGPSEHVGDISDEFETINQRWRIFRKRRDVRLSEVGTIVQTSPFNQAVPKQLTTSTPLADTDADWQVALLRRFLPASLLVDDTYELRQVFGKAKVYLQFDIGEASLNILKLLKRDLRDAVRTALHRANQDKTALTYHNIVVTSEQEETPIIITVTPVFVEKQNRYFYLIDLEPAITAPPSSASPTPTIEKPVSEMDDDALHYINSLEDDLQKTKTQLQTTVEELETANEELQSTNEELQASNEELQTSNEELQSYNEELYTVNAEHQQKIEELTQLTNDMRNFQRSSQVGTIFLDANLRIRDFSSVIAEIFHFLPQDIGRPLEHLVYNLNISLAELEGYIKQVLADRQTTEREIHIPRGPDYLMRILPYTTEANEVEGVVLTFSDITSLKQTETALRESESRYRAIINSQIELIARYDPQRLKLTFVNEACCRFFQKTEDELIGASILDFQPEQNHESVRQNVAKMIKAKQPTTTERQVYGPDGQLYWQQWLNYPIIDDQGNVRRIQSSGIDITDHKQAEETIKKLKAKLTQAAIEFEE